MPYSWILARGITSTPAPVAVSARCQGRATLHAPWSLACASTSNFSFRGATTWRLEFFSARSSPFLKAQSDHFRRIFDQRDLPDVFLRKPACVVGIPARLNFAR